jgi:hypothetical protein
VKVIKRSFELMIEQMHFCDRLFLLVVVLKNYSTSRTTSLEYPIFLLTAHAEDLAALICSVQLLFTIALWYHKKHDSEKVN